MRMLAAGEDFTEIKAEGSDLPVFCESHLYERLGKGDARFVLAVAHEYAYLIRYLGTPAVKALLKQALRMVPVPDF